jgi:NADPH:quinone reductase-like Zn-dependent oxidoreductase
MQAIRIHPDESKTANPYSANNPAPPSALSLDTIPIPTLTDAGQVLVRVHATTVTRDELTWPETYSTDLPLLGHDVAGTVVAVLDDSESTEKNQPSNFKPGDEVYGMLDMDRGSTWAEYAIARPNQIALKPKSLGWAESAAVPISGLTAWQALFVHARVTPPDFSSIAAKGRVEKPENDRSRTIAITGATGAVGNYLVQLANLVGLQVFANTTSKAHNEEFLKSLGASEVLESQELWTTNRQYDIIIDAVGGQTLEHCWSCTKDDGTLVSIESASMGFVERHRQQGIAKGKDGVCALFFIVEPSSEHLGQLSWAINHGLLKVFVAEELPLREAKAAYELGNGRPQRRGKVVLTN